MHPSGINGVGDIPWGAHLCAFYRDHLELQQLCVSFLTAGLAQGQYCLWITAPPVDAQQALKAVTEALPTAQRYMDRQQLEIVPYTEWYVRDGRFDRQEVIRRWEEKAVVAAKAGYEGIRITGNPAWLHTEAQWLEFGVYEREVDQALRQQRMMALCTYPTRHCDSEQMIRTMQNHSHAIYRQSLNGLEWKSVSIGDPLSQENASPACDTPSHTSLSSSE